MKAITRLECAECGAGMPTDGRILCPASSEHIGAVEVLYLASGEEMREAVAQQLNAENHRLQEQLEMRRLAKIECEKENERLRDALQRYEGEEYPPNVERDQWTLKHHLIWHLVLRPRVWAKDRWEWRGVPFHKIRYRLFQREVILYMRAQDKKYGTHDREHDITADDILNRMVAPRTDAVRDPGEWRHR